MTRPMIPRRARWPKLSPGPDQGLGQVLENVLGMIELGTREVRRVAADVGDGEAARLSPSNPRVSRAGRAHPTSVLARGRSYIRDIRWAPTSATARQGRSYIRDIRWAHDEPTCAITDACRPSPPPDPIGFRRRPPRRPRSCSQTRG